ncbi:HD domain-containing protein [Fusibacter sp. 3D3]|uniref:HD domain-containing protein n=1 Tax=Fusibacter sp. 3D3 TaxID=1048380 RepID=UPI000852A93A|nr:HD domain-containing protein [Fusibacter sp. 3D3]GAU79073.1 hypothetical protein F3D3_3711 [Fusibacter sp. 3D3]
MSNKHNKDKIETVSKEWVDQIRCEILPFTERSLYEHSHFLNVERHIKALASQRKLDENLALCIAYFHDVSRIMEGVSGKIHSKRSAEIAKARLKKMGMLSKHTRKVIYSAILHHNQKSKVHGPFEELIKDADSLAHQDEFGMSIDNEFEQIRLDLMALDEIRFSASEESFVKTVYSNYCEHFMGLLSTPPNEMNHWVHEMRTTIRKLQALLYFGDNKPMKKDMLLALKPIFKVLSKSRSLYVLSRSLDAFEPLSKLKISLEVALKEAHDRLIKHIKVHYTSDYVMGIEHLLSLNECHLKFDDIGLSKMIKRYFQILSFTELDDSDALHQLRIKGKPLKYILGSDLLKMTHPVFQETLLTLHELLGDLNDIQDRDHFFKHYKMSSDEKRFLMDQTKLQTKFLKTELKKRLFLLKKLMNLNKIIL